MFDFKIERIRKTAIDYSKNLAFKVLWFFPDDNWCRFGNQETPFYKMSFFSSSSGHRVGELEEWTSEIYFDPEADSSSGSDYRYIIKLCFSPSQQFFVLSNCQN